MQALPDLVKFMDSLHNKTMQCHGMLGKIEIEMTGAATPGGKESATQAQRAAYKPFIVIFSFKKKTVRNSIWIEAG